MSSVAPGFPYEVGFATKRELDLAMLERAYAAGVLRGWVTADELYGQKRGIRDWLAARAVPFVLATPQR
jgi:SRSO17 transposase